MHRSFAMKRAGFLIRCGVLGRKPERERFPRRTGKLVFGESQIHRTPDLMEDQRGLRPSLITHPGQLDRKWHIFNFMNGLFGLFGAGESGALRTEV